MKTAYYAEVSSNKINSQAGAVRSVFAVVKVASAAQLRALVSNVAARNACGDATVMLVPVTREQFNARPCFLEA